MKADRYGGAIVVPLVSERMQHPAFYPPLEVFNTRLLEISFAVLVAFSGHKELP